MLFLSRLDADRLRHMIRRLLQFITIRQFLVAGSQSDTNKTKLWIPAATKVLALISMCHILSLYILMGNR